MDISLDQALNCLGYYGFGTGWRMLEAQEQGEEAYCNTCRVREACWALHRARTRTLLPGLVEYIDVLLAEGKTGGQIVEIFVNEHKVPDPFMALMLNNIQVASFRRFGEEPVMPGEPKFYPTWPLVPVNWEPEPKEGLPIAKVSAMREKE